MLGAFHSNLGNILHKLIEKLSEVTNLALNLIFEVRVKKGSFYQNFWVSFRSKDIKCNLRYMLKELQNVFISKCTYLEFSEEIFSKKKYFGVIFGLKCYIISSERAEIIKN